MRIEFVQQLRKSYFLQFAIKWKINKKKKEKGKTCLVRIMIRMCTQNWKEEWVIKKNTQNAFIKWHPINIGYSKHRFTCLLTRIIYWLFIFIRFHIILVTPKQKYSKKNNHHQHQAKTLVARASWHDLFNPRSNVKLRSHFNNEIRWIEFIKTLDTRRKNEKEKI